MLIISIEKRKSPTRLSHPPLSPSLFSLKCTTIYSYYIRSRAKPDYFWTINFVQQLGRVALTNQGGPPKFIIQRANPLPYDCSPEEDILIGSDEVTITVILGDTQEAIVIGDSDNNTLQLGRNAPALKFEFGLLTSKGGFGVKPWATDIRFKSDGYGDEWELVN